MRAQKYMKKSLSILIPVLIIALVIIVFSINNKDDVLTKKERPKVVNIWSSEEIVRDPVLVAGIAQSFNTSLLYEPLFLSTETNEIIPNIAKSYEISKDGSTITIKIDETRDFSDGSKLTSNDVKKTIARINSSASKFASFVREIKGNGEAKSGPDFFGIKTPDENTVVFELIAPNPFFVYSLAQPITAIIPSASLNEKNEIISDIGSGKYTISNDAKSNGEPTVFTPRDERLPVINIYLKTQTEIDAMGNRGDVDIAFGQKTTPKEFTRKNISLFASGSWNVYVKDGDSALNNVKFRQAVLLAIDTKASLKAYGDKAIEAKMFYGNTIDGVDCALSCKTSKKESKTILKEIYPDGNIPNVSIDIEESELQKSLADTAKKELAGVGIPSTITVHDSADWANVLARGEISLFRFGWVSEVPISSDSLVDNYKASSNDNLSGVVDTALEKKIENYEKAATIKSKVENSNKIQERIKELHLSKPIAQYVYGVSVTNRISIPNFDSYGRFNIYKLTIS